MVTSSSPTSGRSTDRGMPLMLSSLKSLLETGRALPSQ
jgi:hypothetical protein